jgi:hypothetical protein
MFPDMLAHLSGWEDVASVVRLGGMGRYCFVFPHPVLRRGLSVHLLDAERLAAVVVGDGEAIYNYLWNISVVGRAFPSILVCSYNEETSRQFDRRYEAMTTYEDFVQCPTIGAASLSHEDIIARLRDGLTGR